MPHKPKPSKRQDEKIRNLLTAIGVTILAVLFFKNAAIAKTEFVFDVAASVLIVMLFYKFYNLLHQDSTSYLFLLSALIAHNLGIYATSPFGIRFDHYMHFLGGFTLAIVGDRIFNEKLGKSKRFALLIIFALGIGAIGEVFEWLGYGILGEGEGFFFYGIGDEGEWRNSMLDLVFNSAGALLMAILAVFRKPRQ